MLMPFFWMLSTSIKDPGEIFLFPVRWIPSELHLENYRDALTALPFDIFFRNTAFVTVVATLGQLLSASLVGFGFARLRAPGRGPLFLVLIATMLLPEQVTMIPHFVIFRNLGLIDSLWSLIVPSWLGVYAFYIFLCRQFFLTLPLELDDAARIDGASFLTIYWRIILPLSKPVLASVAVFSFLYRWNDFLHPVIYLTDQQKYTLSLGLALFRDYNGIQWHWLMAASIVSMLPCLVVFAVAQRLFVRGIATTGLKG
jgi:ABC-type glycerol-3-phosphate transport system permease component